MDLSLDWRVTAFTAGVALATAAIFGTAPAFRAARVAPIDALKMRAAAQTRRLRPAPARLASVSSSLVVAQVSLSLALVIVAALFVRTFERLASVPLGFDPDRVLVVNVDMQRARADAADACAFSSGSLEAVGTCPASRTPAARSGRRSIAACGWRIQAATWPSTSSRLDGSPRTARRSRRTRFHARDTAGAPPVAIVNEAYVREFVPGRSPIGETSRTRVHEAARPPRTIVGVVDDAVFDSQREGTQPMVYLPLAQSAGIEPAG